MERTQQHGEKAEVSNDSGVSNSRSCAVALAIEQRIDALGADHGDVLAVVFAALITRAEGGTKSYGVLDLATDERDFQAEGFAELVDGIQYIAAENVKLKRENARLHALVAAAPAVIPKPAVDLAFDMTDADVGGEG